MTIDIAAPKAKAQAAKGRVMCHEWDIFHAAASAEVILALIEELEALREVTRVARGFEWADDEKQGVFYLVDGRRGQEALDQALARLDKLEARP